jgi:hypothetical protein
MYQFIHLEIYAKQVSKKAITRRTKENKDGTRSLRNVRQIIAEAKREPDACPHVENPQLPIHIFGVSLDAVETLAYESTDGKTDTRGRKLRDDTPIILAGIASYPREEYESNPDNFKKWLDDTIAWLHTEYGDNLKNITMHLDEPHPHIHFYAISPTGRAKDIHAGHVGEQQQKAEAENSNASNKNAYKEAMREFQLRYYLDVGAPNGMLKDGPRKLRESRPVYKSRAEQAKELASVQRQIESMGKQLSEEMQLQSDDIKAQAIADAEIEARAIKESMLDKIRKTGEFLIKQAQKRAQAIIENAERWSKDVHQLMARLIKAEAEVLQLRADNEAITQERDALRQQLKGKPDHRV